MLNRYKNILFRTDSSSRIGTGHIMRDLVLAKQYKSSNIIFATQELDGNINDKIKENGYKIDILKSNDIEEVDILIKKYSIDMIIIDNYDINYSYEKELKEKNIDLIIMVLDDIYLKHHCDILLNHNIYANKEKYKKLVSPFCDIRCGEEYTLLRDEFKIYKDKLYKNSKFTFFISIGGADILDINITILEILNNFDNININIVTTNANKKLEQLKEYCKHKSWINLHINSNNIASLIKQSNIAIVTASMVVNEIIYMKIPFIAIKVASNQEYMYKYLKDNYVILDRFDLDTFKNNINQLYKDIV
jgi:UDP-2,4-diacetamido-2,4,6-trideoxy-beta-L-altropyranose hydrolase